MAYWQIPQYIIFSITGTFLLIGISKKIAYCDFLEYFGRNTLVIYATNITVMAMVEPIAELVLIPSKIIDSLIFIIIFLVLYFVVQTLMVFLFNKKPLTYVSGKWK